MAYPKQTYPVSTTYQYQQTTLPNHHTVIVQNQTRPVYVTHAYQKTTSERIAGNIGGALASAARSGGHMLNNSKSAGYSLGTSAARAAKSGARVAGEAAKGFSDELDRTAKSPLLDCFVVGSGVQLISKSGNGCLRCLPDGSIDGKGLIGNDYSCHWLVVSRWENKIVLRNGQFWNFFLSNIDGMTVGTGTGDGASVYKLHETYNHFVRLEHEIARRHVALDSKQNVARPDQYDNTLFDVHLVYSPTGHLYKTVH